MKNLFKLIFLFPLLVNGLVATEHNFLQNVDIHGDVRTKWKSEWGGYDLHGFKTEACMGCDYIEPQAWVSVKLKASTYNGKDSNISLDKAFLGFQFYQSDKIAIGAEVGRNKMDSMFDSKMQFNSNFNGAHLIYKFNQHGLFDFTMHGGPHIVNADKNHYAWLGEVIFSHIASCPLTLKYSFTDWNAPKLRNTNEWKRDENYLFSVSQMSISYEVLETIVYGAYLFNHQESSQNDGFYMGFTLGKIRKNGDFSFDVCLRASKVKCISPSDSKGIRRGAELKATYALATDLYLEGKFTLYEDFSGLNNNRRLEFQAVYSW